MSPSGRSFAFDHRADGYGRGEGAACVVLQRIGEDEQATVRALIRNAGLNHCGRSIGITVPSGEAQSSLISRLYREIGLDPCETPYVEAHGTGTARGDPIEAQAIATTFARPGVPVHLGSVKANFGKVQTSVFHCIILTLSGHTEGASGVVSLIKAVLMLEKETILPCANFEKVNPAINLDSLGLKVHIPHFLPCVRQFAKFL